MRNQFYSSYACNILPFAENISKQDFPEKPVKLYSVMNITIIKKTYDLKVRYRNNNALFLLRLTEDNQIILEAKTWTSPSLVEVKKVNEVGWWTFQKLIEDEYLTVTLVIPTTKRKRTYFELFSSLKFLNNVCILWHCMDVFLIFTKSAYFDVF